MKTLFFLLLSSTSYASQVRDMTLKPQDVGTVNTAVGYSTVVQVLQKPLNVVIGDQADFRVEFIGNNITVKPIKAGAKTNLFIFTENDRFNLTIKSGPPNAVDYVVKLKRSYDGPKKPIDLNWSTNVQSIQLTILRKTKTLDGSFVEFKIKNLAQRPIEILPAYFRVAVHGSPQSVKDLFLEKVTINPFESISGSAYVLNPTLDRPFSIWLATHGSKPRQFPFLVALPKKQKVVVHAF